MFDPHRPPEQTIVDDCIHCGFCLDACPTYVLWAQEADSPRGRIVLVDEQLHSGRPLSAETVSHFDSCLGCMACVTACPSGVRYDRLIERVRPQIERNFRRSAPERALRRLIFSTLPHPRRMRALQPGLAAARLRARRRPARAAPGDGPTRSADASPPRPRPDTRARPGVRQTARPSGPAPGMRAASLLSAGARGHDRGARSRGLRGIRVAGARVLWRARASRRGGTGGDRARD